MLIRTPSPALRKRIIAAGETGPLVVETITGELDVFATGPMPWREWPAEQWKTRVLRAHGRDLSDPEQRRVAGLVAADDAEPFT